MLSHPYDTYDEALQSSAAGKLNSFGIKVVSSLNELMHVVAVRSAVYMSEQNCPYDEEFDGNDFAATHLVAYKGREPIACIRVRFFAEFAKLERLAVRHEYRTTRVSFKLVAAAIELARKKGYTCMYGHAQDRLVNFWSHFGASPMSNRRPLTFSDFSYTEMLLQTPPMNDTISLHCDPYVLIRPEGKWHRPGILEQSATRPITSPLRDLTAA